MSKNIYIARHCATMINDEDRLQGSWIDCPLSKNGKKQAEELHNNICKNLNGKNFDLIIVSPTFRTMETAEIVSPDTKTIIDSRILVYDIGTADAVKKDDAYTFKGFPIPGIYKKMENPYKYYKRVDSFFEDLTKNPAFNDLTILVVTHEDITALANHFLLGKNLLSSLKTGLDNGKFAKYELENVKEINDDSERI